MPIALCQKGHTLPAGGRAVLTIHSLLQYAKEHGITITGNAYEERLIDEVGAFDKEQQIIQVSIQVSV